MNAKMIKLGIESREELIKGIEILSNAVVSTLGPYGRNVIIDNNTETPLFTKDGVTVAKSIVLKDSFQNQGACLLKQAALRTNDKTGDGTTTATLLAFQMILGGVKWIDGKANASEVKRQIEYATKKVVDELRDNISKDVKKESQLKQIATISSNNDGEIGNIISKALIKAGNDGVVHIEKSKTGETFLEEVEGIQFNSGYKSPYFVKDNKTMSCVLNKPYILLCANKIQNVHEILDVLNLVSQNNRSLLIIAEDISGEALATLLVNKSRGTLDVVAVKAPDHGDRRKTTLDDIAVLTGGKVFDSEKGMKWSDFSEDWFGESRICTVGKDKTTIVDVKGNDKEIEKRIEEIKSQIDKNPTAYEKQYLQSRLSKMSGGVEIVYIGGLNEPEINEKTDRAEDALNATRAAMESGILPGGGVALLHARKILEKEKDTNIGCEIVYNACAFPFNQIILNSGLNVDDSFQNEDSPWEGYDIFTSSKARMDKIGVIDPTKVTITALQNAASVAGIILTTECVIVNDNEDKKPMDAMETLMNQGLI